MCVAGLYFCFKHESPCLLVLGSHSWLAADTSMPFPPSVDCLGHHTTGASSLDGHQEALPDNLPSAEKPKNVLKCRGKRATWVCGLEGTSV